MKKTIFVKPTSLREYHCNVNPRVIEWDETEKGNLRITFDSSIPVPAAKAHQAKQLGLDELAAYPHS
ncbi:MAG TPA: hypothetical protein VKX41_15055 [Alloacidobacterium sp.]|jgi:hypothetical protein|nr:hypothetical protein [Alloacidobacterium sp.]